MGKPLVGLVGLLSILVMTTACGAARRDAATIGTATPKRATDGRFRISQKADYQYLPPEHKSPPPDGSSDAGDESGFSDWLTADGYQALFNQMTAKNLYPRIVEGRSFVGERQFRAKFVDRGNAEFWTHHGLSPRAFAERDNVYRSQGFRLVSRQSAQDGAGEFVQATWLKD
jgi:hypothetical protein